MRAPTLARRSDPAEAQADRAAHQALQGRVVTSLAPARPFMGHSATPMPGSGAALDGATRADMEARFGHDFAQVRVHADAGAQQQARRWQAEAFTLGPHIGFAAGRFAPHTTAGRELLAHELAHVVQQTQPGAVQRPMCKPDPKAAGKAQAPTTVTAVPATDQDKRDYANEALKFLEEQGRFFAMLPKPRDLATTLPLLRTSLNSGLQAIQADTSSAALDIAEKLRTVYTEAVRQLILVATKPQPGSSATPPTLLQLYDTHRALIEPFALPVDSGAAELSAELEAPLPAGATRDQRTRHAALARARQRLKVSTSAITMSYADLFGPGATGAGVGLPAGMTVRIASIVPATLHKGLEGMVARMGAGILEPDSTLMLALDLRRFGGGRDAYRFTRIDLAGGRAPQIEVWVERQGAILTEGLSTEERKALQQHFDNAGFKKDSSYSSTAEFDQALIGTGEVPQSHLSGLSGLLFKREPAHATSPTTSAEYRMAEHEIAVFDRAYSSSISRQGRAGRVLEGAAYVVAHELGHAADWNVLRTTSAANKAAQDALLAEFGTGPTTWGYGADATQAQRDRYRVLDTARATARTAQMGASSRSGAHWENVGGVTQVTHNPVPRRPTPAFEAAARQDDGPGSPRFPTNYPNVDPDHVIDEYYAECFALYQTNADLLRRIRPHVFAFFQTDLPK